MSTGVLSRRRLAALVSLAGDDGGRLLRALGAEAPSSAEVAAVDRFAEDELLEDILRLASAAPKGGASPEAAAAGAADGARPVPPGAAAADPEAGREPGAPLDAIDEIPPRRFAQFLGGEHPQAVALILASMAPKRAAEIVACLDPALRTEALCRVARLESLPSGALERALSALRSRLRSQPVETVERSSGIRLAAELLKQVGRTRAQEYLAAMSGQEPKLSEKVEQNIYTFEDLVVISPADMRKMVPRLDRKALATALAAAPEEVKELVLAAMSSGMRAALAEEMEYGGVKRLAEIQAAQRDIVQTALEMDADGQITFTKGGEEEPA